MGVVFDADISLPGDSDRPVSIGGGKRKFKLAAGGNFNTGGAAMWWSESSEPVLESSIPNDLTRAAR